MPVVPRIGGQRADAGFQTVRDNQRLVEGEQAGDLPLVGLKLIEGAADRRLLVRRVLELNHAKRQAVDEDYDIGAAVVLTLDDGELVDRQPVVVVGMGEVDRPDLVVDDPALVGVVLHVDTVHEIVMEAPVVLDQAGALEIRNLADGFLDSC